MAIDQEIIRVTGLKTQFGSNVIHDGVEFSVRKGEVIGLVGGSGTGKSVLMRSIVGLQRPTAGKIEVFGQDATQLSDELRRELERRWGVLFQDGALFSSLTVAQNVMVPLKEHTNLPTKLIEEITARFWPPVPALATRIFNPLFQSTVQALRAAKLLYVL